MKFKVTWGKKLIAGILLAAVVVGGYCSTGRSSIEESYRGCGTG